MAFLAALAMTGCGAPGPAGSAAVDVRVTGAVERSGSYVLSGDQACQHGVIRLPPSATPQVPRVFPRIWVIESNPWADPPEAAFRLHFDVDGNTLRPGATQVRMTAGGRLWEGDELVAGSGFTARIEVSDNLSSGRFVLTGLRARGGGAERIAVEGTWRCPAGTSGTTR